MRRADDNVDSLKIRLAAYHRQTAPLSVFYESKGILSKLDATQKEMLSQAKP